MSFYRRGGPGFSKYGNKRTVVDGLTFHSKGEATRWLELRLLQRAGRIAFLRRQVRFPLHVKGVKLGCYVSDFVYVEYGKLVVEDFKGMRLEMYNWKKRHMKAEYGIDILET